MFWSCVWGLLLQAPPGTYSSDSHNNGGQAEGGQVSDSSQEVLVLQVHVLARILATVSLGQWRQSRRGSPGVCTLAAACSPSSSVSAAAGVLSPHEAAPLVGP